MAPRQKPRQSGSSCRAVQEGANLNLFGVFIKTGRKKKPQFSNSFGWFAFTVDSTFRRRVCMHASFVLCGLLTHTIHILPSSLLASHYEKKKNHVIILCLSHELLSTPDCTCAGVCCVRSTVGSKKARRL